LAVFPAPDSPSRARSPRRTPDRRPLARSVARRLLAAATSVLVALAATFALLDAVPGDRVAVGERGSASVRSNAPIDPARVQELRVRHGLVDPDTGAPRSAVVRFGAWAARAVRLELAPRDVEPRVFRQRLFGALAISLGLGGTALCIAYVAGLVAGGWLARRAGGAIDRLVAPLLTALPSLPGVLLATLAVLMAPMLGLPTGGLGCAEERGAACALLVARQLALPVAILALGPAAILARHVREAVLAASGSAAIDAGRGFGLPENVLWRRAWRAGLVPAASLFASFAPALLTGSVVIEQVFDVPGLGRMAFRAVQERDAETLLAVTTVGAVTAVCALTIADLVVRRVEPRSAEA
jgi:peptide/nickel transport system permease protein